MGALATFWQKICVPLDGLLWHGNINHSLIRPMLRNEILAFGACVIAGGILYAVLPWLFWFGMGIGCILWIFWSWAKFFLRFSADTARIASVLWRFALRLLILAILLYYALAELEAPPFAIMAGLVAGSLLGLGSYAWYWVKAGKR